MNGGWRDEEEQKCLDEIANLAHEARYGTIHARKKYQFYLILDLSRPGRGTNGSGPSPSPMLKFMCGWLVGIFFFFSFFCLFVSFVRSFRDGKGTIVVCTLVTMSACTALIIWFAKFL